MNAETATLISIIRRVIHADDLPHLQGYWQEWGCRTTIDWPEVWKRAFLLACEKGQLHTAQWLYERYREAPLGFRLGLRSTINYARAMTRIRAKEDTALLAWLIAIA